MKRIIYLISFTLLLLSGCKEETIGQYPVDNIPPKNVSNIKVENISGGAVITYDLSEEDDLLGVKALYTLPNGKKYEVMSSAYSNSLVVKGFGKSTKTEILVRTIDKSRNESGDSIVVIEPLDSPIYNAYKTLDVSPTSGGILVSWSNVAEADMMLDIFKKDEDNTYKPIETFYSANKQDIRAIRGMDPITADFLLYFRDNYGNRTDTLETTLKPILEMELDKALFKAMAKSSKFNNASGTPNNMTLMWDGITNPTRLSETYYLAAGSIENPYFTIDLGVNARLSRFVLWDRSADNQYFLLHSMRTFELWTWTNPDETNVNDPENWDGWEKVTDYEASRPSGSTSGNPTAGDIAFYKEGYNFDIPVFFYPFRYIRLRSTLSWGGAKDGGQGMWCSEIKFFGNIIDN